MAISVGIPECSLFAQVLSQPAMVAIGVTVVVLAIVGICWLLHLATVRAARDELNQYKEHVVALSNKIDALKERCKLLPHLDKDFIVPMAGETLTVYNSVGQQLERHRGEWLNLMDVWEQAQSLLQSESFLGSRRARQVRRQIKDAKATAAMTALLRDCEAPLDRIEQAHQQVAEELRSFEQADKRLANHLISLQSAGLPNDPYISEAKVGQSLVAHSRTLVPADPIGALQHLAEAHSKINALTQTAVRILEHVAAARRAAESIEQVHQLAAQRRDQGLLLREPEANPDPLLEEARQLHTLAWREMQRANESAAGAAIQKATALATQAQQAIEQHLAAKARCESEIPTRRSENMRLTNMQSVVRGQQQELERDFAPENWLQVADNLPKAQVSLATAQRITETAEQQAAANLQNYFQASRLLTQAAENSRLAESAMAAVGQKLRELIELRMKCQTQIGQTRVQAERVARLLGSNTADRVRANERYRSAVVALDQLTQHSRLSRPDWVRLAIRTAEIQSDLERAEQLAREDIQLAQQAAAEVQETENLIREASMFNELGFRAELSSANAQLSLARSKLSVQEYEEAIRLANAAEQLAREARNDAMARAQRRQHEIDAQRRAEEAARAAATATPQPIVNSQEIEPLLERTRIV